MRRLGMLGTRPLSDIALRCNVLRDRAASLPIGPNPEALSLMLAECAAIEGALSNPLDVCRLRDIRHWVQLAYGRTLHGYPADRLQQSLLGAVAAFETSHLGGTQMKIS